LHASGPAVPQEIEFAWIVPPFLMLDPSEWQYVFAQLSTPCVYVPEIATAVARNVVPNCTVRFPSTWLGRPVVALSAVHESFATVSVWHSSQL